MTQFKIPCLLTVCAILAGGAGACDDVETCRDPSGERCGMLKNHMSVTFKEGTPRTRVDEINKEIGAVVVTAPSLTTTYRIKLPDGWCWERGADFYETKPEVIAAVFAINLCGGT